MYKFLRSILFFFGEETTGRILLSISSFLGHFSVCKALARLIWKRTSPSLEKNVFGLKFSSPVGLAAGIDTNGEATDFFSNLGLGFIEIGSVTPLPQSGNASPRLFRLKKDKALIHRVGLANKGIKSLIENLKKSNPDAVIAVNIARNSISRGDKIINDYSYCFSMLYDFVDMFIINISCDNSYQVNDTDNQSDLSDMYDIIDEILDIRMTLDLYKPVLIKISPDFSKVQIDEILNYALLSGIDGVVAGNTTKYRENLATGAKKIENIGSGSLSGAPLLQKSLETVRYIHEKTKGRLPIIGCGGIMTPENAKEMLDAGASLVEICTGFIFKGPSLIKRINKNLIN